MNTTNKSLYIILGIAGLITVGVISLYFLNPDKPGGYDEFALCIKDSGAVFYGAFWCPHCQSQKKMFGSSAKLLPYVECSTPDGRAQTKYCDDLGIDGYPTWTFKDGSRLSGEIPLQTLSEKTSCPIYPTPETSTSTKE